MSNLERGCPRPSALGPLPPDGGVTLRVEGVSPGITDFGLKAGFAGVPTRDWDLGEMGASCNDAEVAVVEVERMENAEEPEDDLDEGAVDNSVEYAVVREEVERSDFVGGAGDVSESAGSNTAASSEGSGGVVSSSK